jgi:hypothetical protein
LASRPPPRHALAGSLVATVAIGVTTWQACAIYDTSLLLPGPADAAAEADTLDDSSTLDAGPDADRCAHARWPSRPEADDPSTTPDVHVITALRTFDLGLRTDGGAPPVLGFDLDTACTCPAPESCAPQKGSALHCDDDGGRDNAGGALLRSLGAFNVLNQDDINQRIAAGGYGLVIQIRSYNGAANDTRVTVAVSVSNGVSGIEDGGTPSPKDDGTDHWTLDPASLLGGESIVGVDCDRDNSQCVPLFIDENAYVADHVLVGKMDFPLSLGSGGGISTIKLNLTGSIVTATLVPTAVAGGSSFALDRGQLAGRWSTAKLLASLAALQDPLSPGQYVCGGDSTYTGIKTRICASADIEADMSLDNTSAACDALSIAFGFTARPARLGKVYAGPPQSAGCADAGTPFHDDCSK